MFTAGIDIPYKVSWSENKFKHRAGKILFALNKIIYKMKFYALYVIIQAFRLLILSGWLFLVYIAIKSFIENYK